ncbi:uncharacterized protein LOC132165008 [Corylus avellana]|uniref:uncharacterized protein LOC132165008 n=1 Tax=Corylus avellana TaxID=13451 RepID=UPI00286BCDDC|nr:uncharacterized protein LOC132165008 [Corylus avellana]
MKIISWNCRGLGNLRTVRELCRLVKQKQPIMVFLMETKLRKEKMESIRCKLEFASMFVVESVGKSGGMALLWGEDVNVTIQNFSQRHINGVVKISDDGVPWKFTGFYGHPEVAKRSESWALLQHLSTLNPAPWVCIGDFNEIVTSSEKWGGGERAQRQMFGFRQVLENCGLSDLGFRGPKYTWSNCRDNHEFTKERLDRGVANLIWRDLFPEVEVMVENTVCSDHTPLMLCLKGIRRNGMGLRRFRYEAAWRSEEGLQKRLQVLQGREEHGVGEETKAAKKELELLLEKSDIHWKQRAKIDWMRHVDRNTKFYHACANARRKSNTIYVIKDAEERLCTAEVEVQSAFINYFTDLFTSDSTGNTMHCLRPLNCWVTEEMNRSLLQPFTEEEVLFALSNMAPLKAPGPDGFPAEFFQKNWHIVGKDICNAILESLQSGSMPEFLNFTHIVLIPKLKNPSSVSDYRPISLYNVIYKLISKMLANRLKKILPHVISPAQSAFIPGRLITDNVLAAYETLHTMHTRMKGKQGFMAIKLDMSKAYDRMEWGFLEAVMRRLGFDLRWINLIMMCVTTVQYAVVVNGRPCGRIKPQRGLRQGDPISPYLFILCAEALSAMLSQANEEGALTGVATSRRGPRISHLFFADDSLLFCKANLPQWDHLTSVLRAYEEDLGQRLNNNKTSLFFSWNTSRVAKRAILEASSLPDTQRYDTYLGLPALVGKSRMAAFKRITDRVWKRLQDWKLKFLSQAGKEVLLKAVIQALPTYCMSVFLLPRALCREINSQMRKFWWGHKENDSRALLAKQSWRLWNQPDSLVAKIMNAKYYPDCSILEAKIGRRPSFAWRSIQSSCELLNEGLIWRVGNGCKINIWKDRWVPIPTTCKISSPPSLLNLDAKASFRSSFFQSGDSEALFSKEEIVKILEIPTSCTNQVDLLIWRGTKNGIFSVKSAYHLQQEREVSAMASSSTPNIGGAVWKRLWKLPVPQVEKNFLWKACHNILLTRENLYKRKIISDPLCPVCGLEVETGFHILWQCASAMDVWAMGHKIFQKSYFAGPEFLQVVTSLFESCSQEVLCQFVGLARRIWLRRNELVHGGLFSHPKLLMEKTELAIQEFNLAQARGEQSMPLSVEPAGVRWSAPLQGWVKANWDAALDRKSGWMGLGVVIRDSQGNMVAARCEVQKGSLVPAAAEAQAFLLAVQLCRELGLEHVHFEGDAKAVIDSVISEQADYS